MSNVLNYISPLPFYMSRESIDVKNDYAFGVDYKNIVYFDGTTLHLPSFILHTDVGQSGNNSISGLTLRNLNTNAAANVPITNMLILHDSGYETILHKGLDWTHDTAEGKYCLEVYLFNGSTTTVFYSDTFYVTGDIHNYVKLSWQNDVDLQIAGRIIPFTSGFTPYCYVDSHIGKPSYEYEEEVSSRLGYDFIEMQLSKKVYRFVFILPEYMCDAVRLMKVCNHKQVTRFDFPNYGKTYDLMNMTFEVNWEEQGNLAGAEISFSVDNILSNTSGYMPLRGDFNNDYNSDFNNY